MCSRGYHVFPSENLGVTRPKNFVGIPSIVSENLGYRKNSCIVGGITFFPRKILVSQCKRNSWAPLQRFTKIGVWRILCIREAVGITFLRRKILSHSTQKCRCGTVRCFRNLLVTQKFMLMKRISLNSVEKVLSHSAEKLREGILLFLKKFWFRKVLWMKRGVSHLSVELFRSHSAEKIRGHHFNASRKSGYRKFFCRIVGITNFPRKMFVSQYRKTS